MGEKEKLLLENFEEYYGLGVEAYQKKKFNAATTLFFKALAALCDLYLLRTEGTVPSSHTNRFRLLESRNKAVYKIIDRDFPFYQDSYTMRLDYETATLLKEDVERLKKIVGVGKK